jgi:hypothetical protein
MADGRLRSCRRLAVLSYTLGLIRFCHTRGANYVRTCLDTRLVVDPFSVNQTPRTSF